MRVFTSDCTVCLTPTQIRKNLILILYFNKLFTKFVKYLRKQERERFRGTLHVNSQSEELSK